MSEHERNIGTLTPIKFDNAEEWAEKLAGDTRKETTHDSYDSFLEMVMDDPDHYGFEVINNKPYLVEFDMKGGDEIREFCEIEEGRDGSIRFDSYHYNGGGHWTELVENAINSK